MGAFDGIGRNAGGFGADELDANWRELRSSGARGNSEPDHLGWKTWGDSSSIDFVFTSSADDQPVTFPDQLIQASFHHPVSWVTGFNVTVSDEGHAHSTKAIVAFNVLYGSGRGRFRQKHVVTCDDGESPTTDTFGPVPSETVQCNATALLSPPSGVSFPYRVTVRIGAWTAPQVWP